MLSIPSLSADVAAHAATASEPGPHPDDRQSGPLTPQHCYDGGIEPRLYERSSECRDAHAELRALTGWLIKHLSAEPQLAYLCAELQGLAGRHAPSGDHAPLEPYPEIQLELGAIKRQMTVIRDWLEGRPGAAVRRGLVEKLAEASAKVRSGHMGWVTAFGRAAVHCRMLSRPEHPEAFSTAVREDLQAWAVVALRGRRGHTDVLADRLAAMLGLTPEDPSDEGRIPAALSAMLVNAAQCRVDRWVSTRDSIPGPPQDDARMPVQTQIDSAWTLAQAERRAGARLRLQQQASELKVRKTCVDALQKVALAFSVHPGSSPANSALARWIVHGAELMERLLHAVEICGRRSPAGTRVILERLLSCSDFSRDPAAAIKHALRQEFGSVA